MSPKCLDGVVRNGLAEYGNSVAERCVSGMMVKTLNLISFQPKEVTQATICDEPA